MIPQFQSSNGRTFEAWLREGALAPVRMVVQLDPPAAQDMTRWSWTVWIPQAPWQHPETDWHGVAASRDVAESRAAAAARQLVAAQESVP